MVQMIFNSNIQLRQGAASEAGMILGLLEADEKMTNLLDLLHVLGHLAPVSKCV